MNLPKEWNVYYKWSIENEFFPSRTGFYTTFFSNSSEIQSGPDLAVVDHVLVSGTKIIEKSS